MECHSRGYPDSSLCAYIMLCVCSCAGTEEILIGSLRSPLPSILTSLCVLGTGGSHIIGNGLAYCNTFGTVAVCPSQLRAGKKEEVSRYRRSPPHMESGVRGFACMGGDSLFHKEIIK